MLILGSASGPSFWTRFNVPQLWGDIVSGPYSRPESGPILGGSACRGRRARRNQHRLQMFVVNWLVSRLFAAFYMLNVACLTFEYQGTLFSAFVSETMQDNPVWQFDARMSGHDAQEMLSRGPDLDVRSTEEMRLHVPSKGTILQWDLVLEAGLRICKLFEQYVETLCRSLCLNIFAMQHFMISRCRWIDIQIQLLLSGSDVFIMISWLLTNIPPYNSCFVFTQ